MLKTLPENGAVMALIGLISDVHATPQPVAEALALFEKAGVDQIWCAGDIAGYMNELAPTIQLLVDYQCHAISGNHDRQFLENNHSLSADSREIRFLKKLPTSYQQDFEGKRLFMVHAEPPDLCHGGIKLLDKKGLLQADKVAQWTEYLKNFDYDVLIIGHTHQVFAEKLGDTLVINPGSSAFNHSCAILQLPEMVVEMLPLNGNAIETTWNWGQHVIYAR